MCPVSDVLCLVLPEPPGNEEVMRVEQNNNQTLILILNVTFRELVPNITSFGVLLSVRLFANRNEF